MQRDDFSIVLWSYHLEHIIPLCKDFEDKLIKHIWRTRDIARKPLSTATSLYDKGHSRDDSRAEINEKGDIKVEGDSDDYNKEGAELERTAAEGGTTGTASKGPSSKVWGWWRLQPRDPNAGAGEKGDESDAEKAKRKERKLVLIGPFYAGCGAGLAACEFPFVPL